MSTSRYILLDHAHIGDQHIPSFVDSIGLVLQDLSTSRCILLDHNHIGDQHIPFFVDSIGLVLQDYEHIMLHTPRSCPNWRSTHPFHYGGD
jgi:ABC-type ATPase involved in cell division